MPGLLIGCVYQLYQGDLDLGRLAMEGLSTEDVGPMTVVEDLSYGAVAVVQRLEDVVPDRLVLVGAEQRGRGPGTVERRRIEPLELNTQHAAQAVREAITGYVTIDLVVEVASALGALPPTVAVEVEPVSTEPGTELSPAARAGLYQALDIVRAEARRYPLLELAGRIRSGAPGERLGPTPALAVLLALLDELDALDRGGTWGRTFSLVENLRTKLGSGDVPEDMDKLDWVLWWALVEEAARLQMTEAAG